MKMKTPSPAAASLIAGILLACGRASAAPAPFRAGVDSMKFHPAISADERHGPQPDQTPAQFKAQIAPLLARLRGDGHGLSPATEMNIESFFTVADAFEADGLLMQSSDTLRDLLFRLRALEAARAGHPDPHSMIASQADILNYRDCHNVHAVDGKYISGAQPTEKGYRWLKSKGVTTIISLRVPTEPEKSLVESLGMKYVQIPWADQHPPTVQQVQAMLQAVKASPGKVMQHCLRGFGRDMTMAGCYRIAQHGTSANTVITEGSREAPRWVADQKLDPKTHQPVQFELLRKFETVWKQQPQQ